MKPIPWLILFLSTATSLMAWDWVTEKENLTVKPKEYTGPSAHVLNPEKPDVLINSDPHWICKVWYLAKGTRSEGMHVQLLFDGKLLPTGAGALAETKVKTPYGEFEWKGAWKERKNLFDLSGYAPVKIETLYPEKGRTLGK